MYNQYNILLLFIFQILRFLTFTPADAASYPERSIRMHILPVCRRRGHLNLFIQSFVPRPFAHCCSMTNNFFQDILMKLNFFNLYIYYSFKYIRKSLVKFLKFAVKLVKAVRRNSIRCWLVSGEQCFDFKNFIVEY